MAASDPLWVGEADQVQYALSRRVPALRLHFVNVDGTATARERVATALRRAANTVATSIAAGLGRGGRAQDGRPPVVSRRAWRRQVRRGKAVGTVGTTRSP